MRLISKLRDSYDYLLRSRDPHARVYSRNDLLRVDITKPFFGIDFQNSRTFHQLDSFDSTLFLQKLMNRYYRVYKYIFSSYDRAVLVVVGTRVFVLAVIDKDKSVVDITSTIADSSYPMASLAQQIRKAADIGPVVGVFSFRKFEYTPFIPTLGSLLKVIGMTNEQIAQEIENAMIEDNPDPAMPDISDKDRIVQHGFDLKTSFRSNK